MRLTQEIDYAFRIIGYLSTSDKDVVGAPTIAEEMHIPDRFTLRILRKLNQAGLTDAKRGARGGYYLKRPKEEISLYDIILAVDGPIEINRCLYADDSYCSRNQDGNYGRCNVHRKLADIQYEIIKLFEDSKITDLF
ncbi:MAG: Rrf2 family transcriptional regulator [Tissierellia bacterium]|nr:Rrf2 family transcriptional regulator [Tissierellia bacterium]